MNMKQVQKIIFGASAVSAIFSAGFIVGNSVAVSNFKKKALTVQPLITNALASVFERVMEGDMTPNELREFVSTEVNFLNIVLKGGQ
jgi:hypothetical protein